MNLELKIGIMFLNYLGEIMSKLTSRERNALPNKAFAGPDRSYPVQDRSHAANAKARAQQQYNKGTISIDVLHEIDAKANKVLNEE